MPYIPRTSISRKLRREQTRARTVRAEALRAGAKLLLGTVMVV